MNRIYRAEDWDSYRMDYSDPHRAVEPLEKEIAVVDGALEMLWELGTLPHIRYSHEKLLAHRQAVAELFEIPWTAITHRMQRLIYAVNAITQPKNMIAAGVFCGNTFISNAGAGVGPGACYTADNLIGVEIKPEEAERAERNARRIDPTGVARVVAADAVDVVRDFPGPIDLLYLDADGDARRGKGIYLDILESGLDKMHPGTLVLAHNSVNCADRLKDYLDYVRDPRRIKASVNVIFDVEGLEVSVL
ncbi:MAG: class I SAM-dependent methyltransferase [Armatimonadetes bacterium]|nr:class I SAM-dependent methyltransferase [Armatimonadota bacterium]